MIGIYKITNKINQKVYIGQSIDIERRIKSHLVYQPKNKTGIYYAIKKYGADNFEWEILEECKMNELDERERFWISYYNSYNSGYNETRGGQEASRYLDYDLIIKTYQENGNIKKTSIIIGCSERSVSKALKMFNIDKQEIKKQVKEKQKKEILQLDLEHNIINHYKSQQDVLKIFSFSRQSLSNALHNGKILNNYYWQYSNQPFNFDTKKIINRYDINTGELLASYTSHKAALEDIGLEYINKNKVILTNIKNGYRKSNIAFGYAWD